MPNTVNTPPLGWLSLHNNFRGEQEEDSRGRGKVLQVVPTCSLDIEAAIFEIAILNEKQPDSNSDTATVGLLLCLLQWCVLCCCHTLIGGN